MNLKLSVLFVSLSAFAVGCGGKSVSGESAEGVRSDAEPVGDVSPQGDGSQGGQQGGGQQGPGAGKDLVKCEVKTFDGMVNCGALDTVLAPAQDALSRFEVKYEFSCGQQGFVSPLGVEAGELGQDNYQRRAFVFGASSKISLYGMGPLKLESRQLAKALSAGLDLTGCTLLVEVVSIQPAVEADAGTTPEPN